VTPQPTNPNPAADPQLRMCPVAAFDVAARLRVLNCSACGIAFAAPAGLCLHAAQERRPLCCPGGHPNTLPHPDDAAPSLSLALAATLAELADALRQLDAGRARVKAADRPPVPVDAGELKRRCAFLANRAERSRGLVVGRICPVCGGRRATPPRFACTSSGATPTRSRR
jgi:hypothetical protein